MCDIVAQIYRCGSFGGDQMAGGDVGDGQMGYLDGVRKKVKKAFRSGRFG